MPGVKDGTVIQGPDGYKIAKGGQWVDYAGALPKGIGSPTRGGGGGGGISATDQKELNTYSDQAAAAQKLQQSYDIARPSVNRLQTGPLRGTLLDMALPNGGGIMDTLGQIIASPLRATGYISNQDVNDYQNVQRARNIGVLEEQTRQKGVQTEGDAQRISQVTVSPTKTVDVNNDIMSKGVENAQRTRARAIFMSQWAAKYGGLHNMNERGRTAQQVWDGWQPQIIQKLFPQQSAPAPTIRRVR